MKNSGAPSIGDIVEITQEKPRMGLVMDTRGAEVGIRYFKSSMITGTPADFLWWIHRTHVKVVSRA